MNRVAVFCEDFGYPSGYSLIEIDIHIEFGYLINNCSNVWLKYWRKLSTDNCKLV